MFLVVANISKLTNVDALCYSGAAFGAVILVVGLPSIPDEHFTSLGDGVTVVRFGTLSELSEYLCDRGTLLVGVEIMEEARSLTEFDFPVDGNVAIMPGNEGTGLSSAQKKHCGAFVFIPQLGAGTASLNVHVATSLVLYTITKINATSNA